MSLLRRLGIERGEGALFGWGALVLAFTGLADVVVKNAAETFFLKREGAEQMPLVFLANSLLLVVSTTIVGRMAARGDRLVLLPRIMVVLALTLLPLWLLVPADVSGVFWLLLLFSKHIPSVVLVVFWIAIGDLLHARQAKRLFAPLMAGVTLGTIIGAFGSEPLGDALGIAGLLPCAAVALLLAAAATLPLRALRPSRIEPLADGGAVRANLDPDAEGDGDRLRSFGELWRENTLFRLLFVAACCSGLLGPMLYFQFSYVANLATEGEQGLLAFYAQIRGWIGVGILATQLGLTSRLYRRIGVPLASLLSPSMYLLGFFGLSVRLSLPAGVGAMAGTKLQDHAIYDPAQRILFNLFPEAIRVRATALLEGPVKRSGGAVGNIVVLGAIGLGGAVWVGYLALPIALAWIAAIAVLWRGYPRLLLQVSAGRARFGETMDLSEMLDVGTMRVLGATLRDEDPVRCAGAIDLVMEARPELSVVALAEAARDAPAATRGQLVAALDRVLEAGVTEPLASPEAAHALESLLESAEGLDAQTRADVVQGYGRLTNAAPGEETDSGVLESAVGAPEPAVRLAAAAALHRHGAPPASVPDLDAALVAAVDGDDAAARRTAREEYRALLLGGAPDALWERRLTTLSRLLARDEERVESAEAIAEIAARHGASAAVVSEAMLALREEQDPRVRAALLRFVGYAGLQDEVAWLIEHVADRGPRNAPLFAAACDAIRALGPGVADVLLVELSFGKRSTRDALLPIVRDLHVDIATLRELYERELHSIRRKLVHLHALSGHSTSAIVVQRLDELLAEGLNTALLFLTAIHDEKRIAELGELMRRTRNRRHRAIVLEALESLLAPHEKRQLIPLLDDASLERRGTMAARALGIQVPSHAEATRHLLEEYDELTRRLVAATQPDASGGDASLAGARDVQDHGGVLGPVEIALHLKSLPIFEGLTTRQLMDLSDLVTEEVHPPKTVVVREGDYDDCMYLIVDGSVEISKGGKGLVQMGPRDFFGEIAIFEGVQRSATASTLTKTRLLRLQRLDLLRLMEELPAIAICVCQTLSRRVRELTDRIQS